MELRQQPPLPPTRAGGVVMLKIASPMQAEVASAAAAEATVATQLASHGWDQECVG